MLNKNKNEFGFGIGYYDRNASFEDKKTEKLWAKFNDSYRKLNEHLKEN